MDFSYEGILASFQERLTIATGGKKTIFLGLVQRVIDAISYILSRFAYYVEYLSTQTVFTKATKREYIIPQSNFLSYIPSRKIAASGYCFISPDSTFRGNLKTLNLSVQKTTDNAAAVNVGSGVVGIPSTAHNYSSGDKITINGTSNYDGQYVIQSTSTVNQINILAVYIPETFAGTETINNNVAYAETQATKGYAAVSSSTTTFVGSNTDNTALSGTAYNLDITVNGTLYQLAAIDLSATADWDAVAAEIQADLRTATSSTENVIIYDGKIRVISSTKGSSSTIVVAEGTGAGASGGLLAAIDTLVGYTTSIDTPVDGVDFGTTISLPCDNHSMNIADTITIANSVNYIGTFTIGTGTTSNEIRITSTYVAENFTGNETVSRGTIKYTGNTFFITQWLKASDTSSSINVFVTDSYTYYKDTNINFAYLNNDAAVDLGSGLVQIPCTNHNIAVGSTIYLQGTDSYDGEYVTQTHATADLDNSLIIVAVYAAETFAGDEYVFTGHLRVAVKEGLPKTYTYTATGSVDESIEILSSTVDNDEVYVDIVDSDGVVLDNVNIVNELYLVDNTTVYSCQIKNKIDFSGIDIVFGDDIRSRKLASGEFVKISYAETQGVDGNIQEVGKITQINSTVYDSLGNILTLYITNLKEISDGQDEETIESIQKNAPNIFQSGYRAAADNDWKTIIENHPQVYKAQVWTNYDLNQTTITATQNVVYIAAISSDGDNLSIEQEADISVNYLKEKRDITDVVMWRNVDILNAKFNITAKIADVSQIDLKNEVTTTLTTYYDILNREFKTGIHESNFINRIDDISDILYHTTEIYNVEKSKNISTIDVSTSSHVILPSLTSSEETDAEKQIYIVPGSLEIYIQRKIGGDIQEYSTDNTFFKIGEDDGAGSIDGIAAVDIFTPYETYTITGTVDYTTNTLTFSITNMIANPTAYGVINPNGTDDLGFFLQLVYKTKDGNGNQTNDIRLPYFYQIVDFDTEDVVFNLSYE